MNVICYKFRLYPSKAQKAALNETLAVCRLVYNSMVHERTVLHERGEKSPTFYTQVPALVRWKKDHAELKTVHSQVLQNVGRRVELAFQAFFRRVKKNKSKAGETPGYPRLKGVGQYDSITYPQSGFKVGESSVWLSLQGKQTQVKAKLHRTIVGTVKTCTVRRYGAKWFVCFSVEQEDSPLPPCAEAIGLDAGLNSFMALSDGTFIDNPRFFRHDEKALVTAGRRQAKTKKRSKERRKANQVLSRIHERIRNRRHDFVHRTARRLVNQYGVIAVEKLNVKNMLGNHCLAKSISDASWSLFRTVLTQKAESADREVIAVNPAYTSQDCHACGYRAKKKLSERWHFCPNCSVFLDRDTNAAINMLNLATGTNHTGITVCQVTPVEAPPFTAGE
ncbi:MAG: RNA-guided endonuclease InsQ/TnpB family protein [Janthinobacterium lividum]